MPFERINRGSIGGSIGHITRVLPRSTIASPLAVASPRAITLQSVSWQKKNRRAPLSLFVSVSLNSMQSPSPKSVRVSSSSQPAQQQNSSQPRSPPFWDNLANPAAEPVIPVTHYIPSGAGTTYRPHSLRLQVRMHPDKVARRPARRPSDPSVFPASSTSPPWKKLLEKQLQFSVSSAPLRWKNVV